MRLGRIVVLGCLLETVAWGASDREIRVRIQDYRGISPKLWTESLAVAEAILDAAGVKPLWLNCSLSLEDQMDSGCRTKPRPRDIFLRLVPQRNAQRAGFKTACMGYALLPKEGFGVLATVFAETFSGPMPEPWVSIALPQMDQEFGEPVRLLIYQIALADAVEHH